MWYRRTFTLPASWASLGAQRTLLNFGAVDWESEVWVNGVRLGLHRGGVRTCAAHCSSSKLLSPRCNVTVATPNATQWQLC